MSEKFSDYEDLGYREFPVVEGDQFIEKEVFNFTGVVSISDASYGMPQTTIIFDPGRQGEPPGAFVYIGGNTKDGYLVLRNGAGASTAYMDGKEGNLVIMRLISGQHREVIKLDASHAALYLGCQGSDGDLGIRNSAGDDSFSFDGDSGRFTVRHRKNDSLRQVLWFDAPNAALFLGCQDVGGDLFIHNDDNKRTIHLDGQAGDIKLLGADCAEEFDVIEAEEIVPGTVLVIDGESKLRCCQEPYDKKVAGVVSGGNGTNPGIILDKNHSQSKRLPVALNGKVYCKVDAQYAPIEVGDLLTTSPTLGHAMKADDPLRAFGAVIGKALCPLKAGQGLIPILVALQ